MSGASEVVDETSSTLLELLNQKAIELADMEVDSEIIALVDKLKELRDCRPSFV